MGRAGKSKRDDRGQPVLIGHFAAGAGIGAILYFALAFMMQTALEGALPYVILCAIVGGLVHLTRFRGILWGAAGLLALFYVLAIHTPMMYGPAESLVREDPLESADAIVCLSGAATNDGQLDHPTTERLLTALRLAEEGYADTIVRTRLPEGYADVAADAQWLRSGLAPGASFEVVGPVETTWDEAERVRALKLERGWSRVILVTSPMHTKRAAAVFEASGVPVISVPAESRQYSRTPPHTAMDRAYMLRRWTYETAAWNLYKARGRL
jgi:uncharacterized SAM-binding protein YcdF (DUF218 family)